MKHSSFCIAVLLALCACTKSPEKAGDTSAQDLQRADSTSNRVTLTTEQFKLLNIQLAKPETRQMTGTVRANGMLDVPPQNLVTISAPLGGFVKFTELLQGMRVKKGQTLVVLEHPDYIQMQQDYLDSKSQLEFLALEYQRQQELATENVNAVKTLQQSKSNYFSTKAKLEGLRAKLKLINIDPTEIEMGEIKNTISNPSPISGYVTQIHINIGMHVNPTDAMLKIVDTQHLHAEAQVFEKDLNKLVIGQLVRIKLSNEKKERLARVFLIGKEITAERTVRVHCHLQEEDASLIPGMYFSAIIEAEDKSSMTLPDEAVISFDGRYFVFTATAADSHDFEMIEIIKGISEEGYTSVILPESVVDKLFVIRGTYSLLGVLKNKEE